MVSLNLFLGSALLVNVPNTRTLHIKHAACRLYCRIDLFVTGKDFLCHDLSLPLGIILTISQIRGVGM